MNSCKKADACIAPGILIDNAKNIKDCFFLVTAGFPFGFLQKGKQGEAASLIALGCFFALLETAV